MDSMMECDKLESTHRFGVVCKVMENCSLIELVNYYDDNDESYNKIRLFPNELLKAIKILNSTFDVFQDAALISSTRSHALDLEQFTVM